MQDAGLATMPSYPFACECGPQRLAGDLARDARQLPGQGSLRSLVTHEDR
jgi:hypothetical protein